MRTLHSLRQSVSSLSGGQRQTVAIARAVLWNSKLVILDEPTAALGVAQTEQVLNLVRRLADHGLGVVLITHNMNDVFQVADDDRLPVPGPDGGPGADGRRHQHAGRRADHRRALRRPRPAARSGGGRMSAHTERCSQFERRDARRARPGSARPRAPTGSASRAATSARCRRSSAPSSSSIVFGVLQPDSFLTEQNFANLLNQGAAITVLAMGLVFVLLLGEIDLSAGFTAGTGAAILGVTLTEHGWAWPLAILVALAAGVAIGCTIALLVARLGIPCFVVSLAYFLGLQGAMLLIIGEGGTIPIRSTPILDVMNKNMPVAVGWLFAALVIAGFAAATFAGDPARAGAPSCRRRRCRCGRRRSPGWRSSCSWRCSCSTSSASGRTRRSSSRACRGSSRWSPCCSWR